MSMLMSMRVRTFCSYEGFGDIHATLFNRTEGTDHNTGNIRKAATYTKTPTNVPGQVLPGLRADTMRVTQTSTITFNVGDVFNGWQNTGFSVSPFARDLSLRLKLASTPPAKVKVRYISSC
eukprot:3320984-Prymnesium_polylepis.2